MDRMMQHVASRQRARKLNDQLRAGEANLFTLTTKQLRELVAFHGVRGGTRGDKQRLISILINIYVKL